MRFYQTWTPDPAEVIRTAGSDNPVPGQLGFIFHFSLYLLPEEPMHGRYWDPRVGYFASYFRRLRHRHAWRVTRGFIQRYRLEKKDPTAEVSEPVKPIVFYISSEVPDKWRPYLKQAVESWAPVFENAGFRNAIVARDAPTEKEDPELRPRGCALQRDPLDPERPAERDGPGGGRPAQRRGHLVPRHLLARRAQARGDAGTSRRRRRARPARPPAPGARTI